MPLSGWAGMTCRSRLLGVPGEGRGEMGARGVWGAAKAYEVVMICSPGVCVGGFRMNLPDN